MNASLRVALRPAKYAIVDTPTTNAAAAADAMIWNIQL